MVIVSGNKSAKKALTPKKEEKKTEKKDKK